MQTDPLNIHLDQHETLRIHDEGQIVQHDSCGSGASSSEQQRYLPELSSFEWNDEAPTLRKLPAIVAAAIPFVRLSHELRQANQSPDLEEVRQLLTVKLQRYEHSLEKANVDRDCVTTAHYLLCATIDDSILSTLWGQKSQWSQHGLVSAFHMDTAGGEQVFTLLEKTKKSSENKAPLLYLFYLCFSIAFAGKLRISPRGDIELAQIRDSLYRTLVPVFGNKPDALSASWQGETAPYRTKKRSLYLLTSIVTVVLCAFGAYVGAAPVTMTVRLTTKLQELAAGKIPQIALLVPSSLPVVSPHPAMPQDIAISTQSTRIQQFADLLDSEVQRKAITIFKADGKLRIVINSDDLFANGSAEINRNFVKLFETIGRALALKKLNGIVIGYTDNIPIANARFPSNWHLSAARAKAVGAVISQFTGTKAILTEGRAESNPVAENSTAKGRKANRRTEIIVFMDRDLIGSSVD